jgi:hypothetical protein
MVGYPAFNTIVGFDYLFDLVAQLLIGGLAILKKCDQVFSGIAQMVT